MAGRLQQTYLRIYDESNRRSFGGNQNWMRKTRLQKFGCGAVACMDVGTYLKPCENPATQPQYVALLELFQKKYIPVFPVFGSVGYLMAIGLNRYFKANDLKYRAHWGTSRKKLFSKMEEMLKADIPVILCIGENFPNRRRGYKLQLYTRTGGQFVPATTTSGHFMVATAMDNEWIQISSWGKLYYMNKEEWESYVEFHSNWFLNNIMVIKRK